MIRLIRARTLDALHAEIARQTARADEADRKAAGAYSQAADFRDWAMAAERAAADEQRAARDADDARRQAEAAQEKLQADYDKAVNETGARLREWWALADTDPDGLTVIQGLLALDLVRTHMGEIMASCDEQQIRAWNLVNALIGENGREAAAETVRAMGAKATAS